MSLYNFLSELNNICHMKGLIRFTLYVKNIDSLNLTQKVNHLRLCRGKLIIDIKITIK